MTLPPDLTRMIFEYSDDEELARLCMLNKNFSNKVCNSNFWMRKIMDRFGLNPKEIRQFQNNNTMWAYYNHLKYVEEKEYRFLPVAAVERIYHHPSYDSVRQALTSSINYEDLPIWFSDVNKFTMDMLYDFIEYM